MQEKIARLIVNPEQTILDALKVINGGGIGLALVVDEHSVLLGVLSDGDARRTMLKGESLDAPVKNAMNTFFKHALIGTSDQQAVAFMRKHELRHLPVIDGNSLLCGLYLIDDFLQTYNLPNSVVIMAGGKGTRLLPHTLDCPKPMLPVGGRPMLEILIQQCVNAGLSKIYLSVNYLKNIIIDYFGDGSAFGADISYLIEEEPLGTAGSLHLLPQSLTAPLLVMNGDVLTHLDFRHLLDFHNNHEGIATICGREYEVKIPFGVINYNGTTLLNLEEKPTQSHLINAGLYVLDPSALVFVPKSQFMDMPDLLSLVQENGHQVNVCPVHEYWLDVGHPETLGKARKEWTTVMQ